MAHCSLAHDVLQSETMKLPNPAIWLLAPLLGFAVIWHSSVASAAEITVNLAQISRTAVQGTRTTETRYWISRPDCVANDVFSYKLTVNGHANGNLEVWAGTADCSIKEKRSGTTKECWNVYKQGISGTGTERTVSIRTRDIAAKNIDAAPGDATEEACAADSSGASTKEQALTLYFMEVNSGEEIQGSAATHAISLDLSPPHAPTGVTVGVGDTNLRISWDQVSDGDTYRYRFYCDPIRGKESVDAGTQKTLVAEVEGGLLDVASGDVGAETGDDAAVGAGGAAGASGAGGSSGSSAAGAAGSAGANTCPAGELFEGTEPDPAFECGSAESGVTGRVTGLKNNVLYSVSVAAEDKVGNIGLLSKIVCDKPVEVDDFYKVYRKAGGQAGGTFCSLGSPVGASFLAFWTLLGAFVLWVVRRKSL